MKKIVNCTRCHKPVFDVKGQSLFATYELTKNGKIWRTDICDVCEDEIFHNNQILKNQYPNMKWEEINDN